MLLGKIWIYVNRQKRLVTGDELDKLNDKELDKKINDFKIFARVSPKHKLRIVKAFKHKNHIVAMTGDGVNDCPSYKRSGYWNCYGNIRNRCN